MRLLNKALLTVLVTFPLASPTAQAAYFGVNSVASHCGLRRCTPCPRSSCDCQCYTVMKTITKTVYDQVTETKEKVVYDTVWDQKTVSDVRRVAETQYRDEQFTYQRPVYETRTRDVPYTVKWPVYETRSRDVKYLTYVPSYETRKRSVPYTTYRTVTDTRSRTVSYSVPRQVSYQRTIQVSSGCWETRVEEHPGPVRRKCIQDPGCWKWDPCCCRCVYVPGESRIVEVQCPPIKVCKRVWVPSVEQREITCWKTVYDIRSEQVPYTVTRVVPEMHTREVEYTVTRMVPAPRTRTVYYQVARTMSEQRTRTVSYVVTRMVPETGTRTVPFTTWREVPVTRTVSVPRQVPRKVCYTVTRCVPRTVCCQVPVRVCCPVPRCCDEKIDTGCEDRSDGSDHDGSDRAPEPPKELESNTTPSGTELSPVSATSTTAQPIRRDAVQSTNRFVVGLKLYWNGQHEAADVEFQAAMKVDPANAKYAYFHALALHQAGRSDEANQAIASAFQLEQQTPISGWGRVMQRVQGEARQWLEDTRRQLSKRA